MNFSGDIRAAADFAQCDMKPGCPANLKQTVRNQVRRVRNWIPMLSAWTLLPSMM